MSFESASRKSPEKKFKIAIVETSDALENQARDIAEERLTASKEDLKGIKGIFSKIWKHNLFREYYRQREIAKSKTEILESGNIYAGESSAQTVHAEAMNAIVDRFIQEYEEVIHTEVGEEKRTVENETTADKALNSSVRRLIELFVTDEISVADFNTERGRIIAYTTGFEGTQLAQAISHTDNIFAIAEQIKAAVTHGEKLEDLLSKVEIVVGRAKMGVRTEAQFNLVDRIAKKIQSTSLGRFVNETTIASGVAIAYVATVGISQRLASSKAFAWGTFGASSLVGGAIAGVREGVKVQEERQQHAREHAKGKEIDLDAERRSEMEKTIYKTISASSLTQSLTSFPEQFENQESFSVALNTLAQAESRIRISDEKHVDLLSYTDFGSVEKERLDLDIARAEAKIRLRKTLAEKVDLLPEGQSFDEFYANLLAAQIRELRGGEEGMEAQDKLFKKMKRRKVAGAVAKAVLTGITVGGIVQEGTAFLDASREGLIEHALGGKGNRVPQSVTALEGLRRLIGSETPMGRIVNNTILPGGFHVAIPEGIEIQQNPLNLDEITLLKDGEVLPQKIEFKNGILTQSSKDFLAQHDVIVTDRVHAFNATQDSQVTSREFVNNNSDLFHKIQRKFWYDNNTSVFDKNELKLHWGGLQGTGIDAQGNYSFNIAKMTSDGSAFKDLSIDAQETMKQGKLKLLLSLSKDSQSSVVEVSIDAQGNTNIDPQSKIGKMFFKNEGGKLKFVGKFAEIAHEAGRTKAGVAQFEILATHIGEGVENVAGQSSRVENIPISTFAVNDKEPYVMPPSFIPVFGRTPLERKNTEREGSHFSPDAHGTEGGSRNTAASTSENDVRNTDVFDYGYQGLSYIKRKDYEYRMSEVLKNDSEVTLDERKEIGDYLARQEKEHIVTIDDLVSQTGPMNPKCKLSVCIPVAGHQEGKNIYKTLENYLNQTAHKDEFEIVLFVNQPDKNKSGEPITPDETMSEIRRFIAEHPEINVAVMHKVIPIDKARIGHIRKLLNDAVLKRNISRTKSQSHVMVSNDADNKGLAFEYIQNFIDKFEKHPEVDALMGQLDWDLDSYVRNPFVHIGTRLFQYVDLQFRNKDATNIASSGANFAFRSGMYAAVNGYSSDIGLAEDVDLGKAIKAARMGARRKHAVGYAGAKVSRLFTSSRRAEKAIKDGLSPVEQWSNGFSAFDDEVRKMDWESTMSDIDFDSKEGTKIFVERVEYVINRTIKAMHWVGNDQQIFTRALGWLGISFSFTEQNQIKIIDATKLINGLKQYKNDVSEILKRKTEKGEPKEARAQAKQNARPATDPEVSNTRVVEEERINREKTEVLFSSEMEQAKKGNWEQEKSFLWKDYVANTALGKKTESGEKIRQLNEINIKSLDVAFEREMKLIDEKKWIPHHSSLFVQNFGLGLVNDLTRQKNIRFERLRMYEQKVVREAKEKIERDLINSFSNIHNEEKLLIETGRWKASESHFNKILTEGILDRNVLSQAQRWLLALKVYEAKFISDKVRIKVAEEYAYELVLAENGNWSVGVSYFSSIQRDPKFSLFENELRQNIFRKLQELDRLNKAARFSHRSGSQSRHSHNQGSAGAHGRAEINKFDGDITNALRILGLSEKATLDEAKKAYRKFASANHQDKHPHATDSERKLLHDKLAELNKTWRTLKKHLEDRQGTPGTV
ncbi:MAG: hypothetical protein WAW13_02870 [Minisyncoccia bacterium]